jgi:hypothetical protein
VGVYFKEGENELSKKRESKTKRKREGRLSKDKLIFSGRVK